VIDFDGSIKAAVRLAGLCPNAVVYAESAYRLAKAKYYYECAKDMQPKEDKDERQEG
jgi:hypothetical protein